MEWWQTLLMTAGTCFITLLVTFLFNWVTNRPAKKKKEKEDEEKRLNNKLDVIKQGLQDLVEKLKEEVIEERKGCKSDYCSLIKIINKIQEDMKKNQHDVMISNKAQNAGLQSVLKDLLKIRYLEWIKKGYAPLDARDDLEKMYQAYHCLGANGVMDQMRKQFLELPIKPITTTTEDEIIDTTSKNKK